jgi:hypothetical protein
MAATAFVALGTTAKLRLIIRLANAPLAAAIFSAASAATPKLLVFGPAI